MVHMVGLAGLLAVMTLSSVYADCTDYSALPHASLSEAMTTEVLFELTYDASAEEIVEIEVTGESTEKKSILLPSDDLKTNTHLNPEDRKAVVLDIGENTKIPSSLIINIMFKLNHASALDVWLFMSIDGNNKVVTLFHPLDDRNYAEVLGDEHQLFDVVEYTSVDQVDGTKEVPVYIFGDKQTEVNVKKCAPGEKPTTDNHKEYIVHKDSRVIYDDAQATCEALGGTLAIPGTPAENMAILTALTDAGILSDRAVFWIGVEQGLVQSNGNVQSYTDWERRVPRSQCVAMRNIHGKWLPKKCTKKIPFICQVVAPPALTSSPAGPHIPLDTSVTLTCAAIYTVDHYLFKRCYELDTPNAHCIQQAGGETGELTIASALSEDTGTYCCCASVEDTLYCSNYLVLEVS